ncbi:MAG: histidine--tRNA ligase, partial [Candidatus Omnitrophica bacterium]|nr:histidine--tRNA ligase [Candidatus Omnitrophota bacterium]
KRENYSNLRGTTDFSPLEASHFTAIQNSAREMFCRYGYEEIILPVMEESGVFIRGVGVTSDIVEKQMFQVTRKIGEDKKDVVLRPEGTAQVIRYYLQNSLHKKSNFHKFFYSGPMFRGERPQRGRLRQFHHLGAEAIGSSSIYLDAEVLILALKVLAAVGLNDINLKLNSLGCLEDKKRFSSLLKARLEDKKDQLCPDCQRRLIVNPLRVIDCKNKACREVVMSLGVAEEYLCKDCRGEFKRLAAFLDNVKVPYSYDPYLVRGLDYYTNTVFEITSKRLGSQDALGAGGRYNNLISDLGGLDIPAIGFALGVERILLALNHQQEVSSFDVFVAKIDNSMVDECFSVVEALRYKGLRCDSDFTDKSLKGQLRYAQKKGARYVVIVGQDEWKRDKVLLKDMNESIQLELSVKEVIHKLLNSD